MKYYKTLNQYKASNLIYDCEKEIATSYNWYWLAARLNGVMVVNSYSYSPTTIKHYYKIMRLFDELGIKYITLEAPKGLYGLGYAIEHYERLIADIQAKLDNPRSKKALAFYRENEIRDYIGKIQVIKSLRGSHDYSTSSKHASIKLLSAN